MMTKRHREKIARELPPAGTILDAGSKAEIYRLMRQLVSRGMAIILITDELLELIGMSNRIMIMKDGRIVDTIEAPPERKPTERQLIALMISGRTSDGAEQRGATAT